MNDAHRYDEDSDTCACGESVRYDPDVDVTFCPVGGAVAEGDVTPETLWD